MCILPTLIQENIITKLECYVFSFIQFMVSFLIDCMFFSIIQLTSAGLTYRNIVSFFMLLSRR